MGPILKGGASDRRLRPGHDHQADGSLSTGERVPTRTGSYESFYRGVAQAIAGNGSAPVSAESAAQVIRVIEAALESDADGRRVAFQ